MKQTLRYKNEYTLSFFECGDKNGYPILIQHGLIASIDDYDLFDSLSDLGTRLISIARPGYGESSPYILRNIGEWGDIVAVLVDALQLSQFDVLGMSSGAPYSYAIGYRFPERARNLFIFGGIPALYDEKVLACWPYPVPKDASIAEMEQLAYDLFFSDLTKDELEQKDVRDSMMNHCFGIGQDFRLRGMDWGFRLAEVRQPVFMRHSRLDDSFAGAAITSKMLPNCTFEARENEAHFSKALLADFIRTVMARFYVDENH